MGSATGVLCSLGPGSAEGCCSPVIMSGSVMSMRESHISYLVGCGAIQLSCRSGVLSGRSLCCADGIIYISSVFRFLLGSPRHMCPPSRTGGLSFFTLQLPVALHLFPPGVLDTVVCYVIQYQPAVRSLRVYLGGLAQ